nr:unnamed protein product [Digitaria exilis]
MLRNEDNSKKNAVPGIVDPEFLNPDRRTPELDVDATLTLLKVPRSKLLGKGVPAEEGAPAAWLVLEMEEYEEGRAQVPVAMTDGGGGGGRGVGAGPIAVHLFFLLGFSLQGGGCIDGRVGFFSAQAGCRFRFPGSSAAAASAMEVPTAGSAAGQCCSMGPRWPARACRQALPARLARGAVLMLLPLDTASLALLRACTLAGLQLHMNLALLGVEAEDTLLHCSSTVDTSPDGYW